MKKKGQDLQLDYYLSSWIEWHVISQKVPFGVSGFGTIMNRRREVMVCTKGEGLVCLQQVFSCGIP